MFDTSPHQQRLFGGLRLAKVVFALATWPRIVLAVPHQEKRFPFCLRARLDSPRKAWSGYRVQTEAFSRASRGNPEDVEFVFRREELLRPLRGE